MSRLNVRAMINVLIAACLVSGSPLPGQAATRAKRKTAPPAAVKKAATPAKPSLTSDADFTTLVDSYFDDFFKFNPTKGTDVGLHQYDGLVSDYSADGVQRETAMERVYKAKFKVLDPTKLSKLNRMDREILLSYIDNQLLDLEVLQNWKKNPDMYSSGVTSSVFSLIKRDYAPIDQRMQSVIAREEGIPDRYRRSQAEFDARRIPKIYAEVCLEQLPGTIDFFVTSLPDALKTVSNETLRQDFARANIAAINALTDYKSFVADLVAKDQCVGNFALGAEHYADKLRYEQMIDAPLDKLLEDGYAELHKQQKAFTDLAKKVSPNESVNDYLVSISKDHPKANEVIPATSSLLSEIRNFCTERNIVTVPSKEQPKVAETPPFDRALTFASMDTPGAYEDHAKEAYYYITLPEPGWSAQRIEEHLRFYSYPDLINTSVHETYPGHYVQFLWSKQFPSKTRKLTDVSSNSEGWAHYCEQMMIDEGFHKDDPRLKLIQLHDALLRCCRYIVAIEMHAKGMTLDKATDFFMKEGYMEKSNAEREAKRGTMDPTYLVYTFGKMQVLALRDEYKDLKGEAFNLKEFHDRFLKVGAVPLKVVRAEMLNKPMSLTPGFSAKPQ